MSDTHASPHPDLAGFVLGALEPQEAVAFEAHLAGCATCRTEVGELASLPGLLGAATPAVELPSGLRERTLAAVAATDREETAPSKPTASASGGSIADLATRRARREARGNAWRRPFVAVGAVAAGLVLVTALSLQSGDGGGTTTEIALGSVRGEVKPLKLDSGWRLELDLALPRRDQGAYYEAFLQGPAGRVSVGTFNEGTDVVLWAGVPPSVFNDFVIVEQPGGVEVVRARLRL